MSKKTKRRSSKKRIHKNNSKKKPRKYKYSKNKYSKKNPRKYKYSKKRNLKGGADDSDTDTDTDREQLRQELEEKDELLAEAKEFGQQLLEEMEEKEQELEEKEQELRAKKGEVVNLTTDNDDCHVRVRELDQDIIKLTDDNELKDRLIASNEADRDEEIMSIGSILGLNIRTMNQGESLKEAFIRSVEKEMTELKENQRDPEEIERLLARHAQALKEANDELESTQQAAQEKENELIKGKQAEVELRQKSDKKLRDEAAQYKRELERIGGPLQLELDQDREKIGELEESVIQKDKVVEERRQIITELQLQLQEQPNPDITNEQLESDNDKLREENDLLRQINEVQDYDCLTKISTVLPK